MKLQHGTHASGQVITHNTTTAAITNASDTIQTHLTPPVTNVCHVSDEEKWKWCTCCASFIRWLRISNG